ncbi:hypothetical protein HGRIS_007957 [Hohenbuehelia grisea]|uniref:Alpha/beta hydrolase fold-3 domain-containing protein n=1 Tax=Hohenbuehelia grisea TaxID=104357 RepID=A0ABR3J6G3_9AGAR
MAQPLHPDILSRLDPEYAAFHNANFLDLIPPHTLPWTPEIRTRTVPSGASQPLNVGKIEDYLIKDCDARVLTPEGDAPLAGWPAIIYFHGGGWTLGNINSEIAFCTNLCARARCVVISINYRLAPEHPYPAAVEDAVDALEWVKIQGKAILGVDLTKVAVGGSSSGGNLAAVLALKAAELADSIPLVFQLLIVPVTDNTASESGHPYHSWLENADTPWLNTGRMLWFRNHYLPNPEDRTKWDNSPIFAPDALLEKVPSAWIGVTELDILRDEGLAYGEKLRLNGVQVVAKVYRAAPHPIMALDGKLPYFDCGYRS